MALIWGRGDTYDFILTNTFQAIHTSNYGPGSSVGIETELRPGQSGTESRWGRDFPPVQTGPGAHPASYKMGTGTFPGVNCGRGVLLTTHPFWCRGHGRVELYLYPPSGPHRACNGITLSFYTQTINNLQTRYLAISLAQ